MSPSASALGYNRVKASKVTHLSDAEAIIFTTYSMQQTLLWTAHSDTGSQNRKWRRDLPKHPVVILPGKSSWPQETVTFSNDSAVHRRNHIVFFCQLSNDCWDNSKRISVPPACPTHEMTQRKRAGPLRRAQEQLQWEKGQSDTRVVWSYLRMFMFI